MSAVWFTADLHFGHRLVAGLRGHQNTDDHDAEICDAWGSTVRRDDVVWVLGDLAVSRPRDALARLAALPGRKVLVTGNHDACHPMHRDAYRATAEYLHVFDAVLPFARRRYDGHSVLLSHFPYHGDHTTTDRYTQWRLPDLGAWLLHGHTHSTERYNRRQIHVGWDAWRQLVSSEHVIDRLRSEQPEQ